MKNKVLLLSVSATLVWFAATTLAFGQDAANAGKARLRAYTTVIQRSGSQSAEALSKTAAGSSLLPLWTYNISSSRDHNNYSGVMVGRNPFGNESNQSVNVPAEIVPIVITTNKIGTSVNFTTGKITTKSGVTKLDPTKANTSCLTPPNDVPLTLYRQSPIIQESTFSMGGTHIGHLQYVEAFQRANFWAYTQGHQYSVALHPVSTTNTVYIDVPAADGLALATDSLGAPDFCAPLGIIDIGWFDSYLDNTIIPALYPQGVNPGSLPIFLLANVVLASPVSNIFTCCVLGYHSYEGFPIQTYAVMDFDTTGVFGPGVFDTSVSAHEVAEWMNDPYGNNMVPPWGHIGQQPGCQNNLEVGDPLTGTNFPPVTMPNGYSYHLQELVFFSWFYGAPSIAVNGWYSDHNTFKTDAGPPCE